MGNAGTDRARRSGPRRAWVKAHTAGGSGGLGARRQFSQPGTAAVGHHCHPHSEVLVSATDRAKGAEGTWAGQRVTVDMVLSRDGQGDR